jgi:hypothetical protein
MPAGFIPNAPQRLGDDVWLRPYGPALRQRGQQVEALTQRLTGGRQ